MKGDPRLGFAMPSVDHLPLGAFDRCSGSGQKPGSDGAVLCGGVEDVGDCPGDAAHDAFGVGALGGCRVLGDGVGFQVAGDVPDQEVPEHADEDLLVDAGLGGAMPVFNADVRFELVMDGFDGPALLVERDDLLGGDQWVGQRGQDDHAISALPGLRTAAIEAAPDEAQRRCRAGSGLAEPDLDDRVIGVGRDELFDLRPCAAGRHAHDESMALGQDLGEHLAAGKPAVAQQHRSLGQLGQQVHRLPPLSALGLRRRRLPGQWQPPLDVPRRHQTCLGIVRQLIAGLVPANLVRGRATSRTRHDHAHPIDRDQPPPRQRLRHSGQSRISPCHRCRPDPLEHALRRLRLPELLPDRDQTRRGRYPLPAKRLTQRRMRQLAGVTIRPRRPRLAQRHQCHHRLPFAPDPRASLLRPQPIEDRQERSEIIDPNFGREGPWGRSVRGAHEPPRPVSHAHRKQKTQINYSAFTHSFSWNISERSCHVVSLVPVTQDHYPFER